jgi:hypothetical protein
VLNRVADVLVGAVVVDGEEMGRRGLAASTNSGCRMSYLGDSGSETPGLSVYHPINLNCNPPFSMPSLYSQTSLKQ